MKDLRDVKIVEVKIREDGQVLWINTEEGCQLRIHNIDKIVCEINRNIPNIDFLEIDETPH